MKRLDFVKMYDGILSHVLCENLINLFESAPDRQVEIDHDNKPNFTEMNISAYYPKYHQLMTGYVIDAVNQYAKECVDYSKFWPNQPTVLEGMRIKRYNANTGERFDQHVDVCTPESAMRYLAILFYLNDNFEGGETKFTPDMKIKPKTGSVLIFPPTWQYPHAGLEVETGSKYIMSTYLHYYAPVK